MRKDGIGAGDVTYAQGDTATVRGAQEYQAVSFIGPYGIFSLPPQGTRAVLLDTEKGAVCVGIPMQGEKAAPGELLLQSAGGAYLLLKNDGTALLNGQSFSAAQEDS